LLLQSKNRRQRREFLVEGPQGVEAALEAGWVKSLYVSDAADALVRQARVDGVRVYEVTDQGLAALAETVTPQGVVAVCVMPESTLEEVRTGAVVVCAGISDPGNLGTVIRTAAAAGVSAVITTTGSADIYNGKCIRSTVGTFTKIDVIGPFSDEDVIAHLTAVGLPILATTGGTDVLLGSEAVSALTSGDHVWAIGSEAHGLSRAWLDAATLKVRIPMANGVESLNAATAAAICLFTK
jgi:TrmH family RNA methyltransferase